VIGRVLPTLIILASQTAVAETAIPRSIPGDKGRYFLIERVRQGHIVKALHRRVAPDGTVGFTRAETDCRTMHMRELGYGEGGVDKIRIAPTRWFELVGGSSKSDLAHFACAP